MAAKTPKISTGVNERKYRALTEAEQDMLFAFFVKWNGNVNQMMLDKDVPFKSYNQLHTYKHRYEFEDKLVEVRRQRAENVMKSLHDGKMLAVQNALRILESRNVFVYNRNGAQVFDKEGNPVIVENLPFYKEIKIAWEIIKTELGEATSIAKNDHGFKDIPVGKVKLTIVNKQRE